MLIRAVNFLVVFVAIIYPSIVQSKDKQAMIMFELFCTVDWVEPVDYDWVSGSPGGCGQPAQCPVIPRLYC